MVMGEDWCSRGPEFESHHPIPDGHFLTIICCKIWIVCLKRLKINEKENAKFTWLVLLHVVK